MKGEQGDITRLKHILDAISEIESYTRGTEISDFMNNSMMRFACIKQLEIIGEACNHISSPTKERFDSIPWKQIIGLRHVGMNILALIHK